MLMENVISMLLNWTLAKIYPTLSYEYVGHECISRNKTRHIFISSLIKSTKKKM